MRAHRHGEGERGMAIVELAFAVPVLVAVTIFGVWCTSVARTAIVLSDSARDAARAIARGAQPPALDPSITVQRIDEGQLVTIVLSRDISAPFLGGVSLTVREQSTSLLEAR
jgi:Flp pilus assembly protein TadG